MTVKSIIKTKHSAVVASSAPINNKASVSAISGRGTGQFRFRTPGQFAALQTYLMNLQWYFITRCTTPDAAFDAFYAFMPAVCDAFFPVKTITIKDKDPPFMTPVIKHLLRRRNKLFRQGRAEAATALAVRINSLMTSRNTRMFERTKRGSRELWNCVNKLRGNRQHNVQTNSNISADSLNLHYGKISSDSDYSPPPRKLELDTLPLAWMG